MARWIIDPDHTVAAFAIRYMMVASVRGQFNKITGAIEFDPPDVSGLSANVEIDVSSVTTGVKTRDEHLLGPDFFDAIKYPKITFRSKGCKSTGGNRFMLTGELGLHGVTREVLLSGEYAGPVKLPAAVGGETSIGFTAITIINREDYGIKWGNSQMETGGTVLGKDVQITLDVEADLQ